MPDPHPIPHTLGGIREDRDESWPLPSGIMYPNCGVSGGQEESGTKMPCALHNQGVSAEP